MAHYSKSLEDYFRIPILLKNITPLTEASTQRLSNLLYYKHYPLSIDEKYIRQSSNPNTDILKSREPVLQKLYFIAEDYLNEWPEFQVIYKAKFAIGIIDVGSDQKQIEDTLSKIKNQNGVKLIGVLNLGPSTLQTLIKRQNIMKCPQLMSDEQFLHFIQPWLYNCLSLIQSQLTSTIAQLKRQDDTNRTIVFNRLQEKFDSKIMKKKKKYRCIKLCGDYHLMLQMYRQALQFYNEAEEGLRKIDDYLWVLGCLQGKLAGLIIAPQIGLSSNREEYIEELIDESYAISKKTKNWNFQCQNYFKIAKLHVEQPEKLDELLRNFLASTNKALTDDQRFLLYTTIGNLYERSGFLRKRNYFYFIAAVIHLNKKAEVSYLLLLQIQKCHSIKQWPELYKRILHQIIAQEGNGINNQFYLELLSKCASQLSQKEINNILSELNFSNNEIVQLQCLQFLELKEFYAVQSAIKPKQNRIGNRESPRKVGGGFFMSWKRDQNLLFQQNEEITLKGSIVNKIAFPLRVKIRFQIHALSQPLKICTIQEIYMYLQPSSVHKFQAKIQAKGETEEIWVIDKISVAMWNFLSEIQLPTAIKYEIYEKQPEIELDLGKELLFEESCNLYLQTQLKVRNLLVPFCLIKFNVSVYYSIDVGFQQNQIILRDSDNFLGLDFNTNPNIKIHESRTKDSVQCQPQNGILQISLKRLKAHRRYVSRIQFTLQYLRSLNTKYQISKQYIGKCNFFSEFSQKITEITTPTIQRIYRNPNGNPRIIEQQYKIKLKVERNNIHNLKPYVFTYGGEQYRLANANQLSIEQVKNKLEESSDVKELKEVLAWECQSSGVKGEIQLSIPFHQFMIKSPKTVKFQLREEQMENHRKIVISYQLNSLQPTCLSHQILFNPVQLQIDRLYVLRGKSKFVSSSGTSLANTLLAIFNPKCKNSYQVGISFNDGWTYWHPQLIHIRP